MNTLIFTALLWGAWIMFKCSIKESDVAIAVIELLACLILFIGAILFALVNLK